MTLTIPCLPGDTVTAEHTWCGFKVVGDNIDKNVKPRYMRLDKRTQSLHYFNAYAIKDRVDCSTDVTDHQQPPAACNPQSVLPNEADYSCIFENCTTLLTRILVTQIPIFSTFSDVVTWHVEHEQSNAMKEKSVVVSFLYRVYSAYTQCTYVHT
jgi:L1 cell adhesion molecule like protein